MKYFLDTEFNSFGGQLISLALVREDGKSLCLEYPIHETVHPWVAENVIPHLRACPEPILEVDQRAGAFEIFRFLVLDPQPVIITDWPGDIAHMCWAVQSGYGEMVALQNLVFQMVRVNAYPTTLEGAIQHNAWWDAMALRHFFGELK